MTKKPSARADNGSLAGGSCAATKPISSLTAESRKARSEAGLMTEVKAKRRSRAAKRRHKRRQAARQTNMRSLESPSELGVEPTAHPEPDSDANEDAFASLDMPAVIENVGEKCELHTYEERWNSRGELMLLQTGSKYDLYEDEIRSNEAALVATRRFNEDKTLESTTLQVKSPHIKRAMREVIQSYPGININSGADVLIFDNPRCFFHYRKELRQFAEACDTPQAKEHSLFCLKYMARVLRQDIHAYDRMMESDTLKPGLEFNNLWMAFKPGDYVFSQFNGGRRLSKLISMRVDGVGQTMHWNLELERVDFDGKSFGYKRVTRAIDYYDGYKPLEDLAYFPFQHHSKHQEIREELLSRGKKFVSLAGIHHYMYQGMADMLPKQPWLLHPSSSSTRATEVRHRVIIDAEAFYRYQPKFAIEFVDGAIRYQTENGRLPDLEDADLLICSTQMPGFSLTLKSWGLFNVSDITEVQFSRHAFDGLVLPSDKKAMILSLVESRSEESLPSDDVIRGKEAGIIFLLHGPPGVGKTFTAESIAEYTRRPLYAVSCADLGYSSETVEMKLSHVLSLAKRWGAVALLDEADVFMAERTIQDLKRNELVSVLLRILEHFEGILFLTTNRVEVMDSAFKSRIHLPITYPTSSAAARRSLWKAFILRASGHPRPRWMRSKFLVRVSAIELNGRQIKNAVRVAYGLAANANRTLEAKDIDAVLRTLNSFDDDFKNLSARRMMDAEEEERSLEQRKLDDQKPVEKEAK